MLVEDKKPPPEYSEGSFGTGTSPANTYNRRSNYETAGAGAAAQRQHGRHASTLYDDMEDPFSNSAAVPAMPVPSSSTSYNRTTQPRKLSTSPPLAGSSRTNIDMYTSLAPSSSSPPNRRGSTGLRAVSPHSFEYVAPEDLPFDDHHDNAHTTYGAVRRSSAGSMDGEVERGYGTGRRTSLTAPVPHASYYDDEDQNDVFPHNQPTEIHTNDSLMAFHAGDPTKGVEDRGMQPLGS